MLGCYREWSISVFIELTFEEERSGNKQIISLNVLRKKPGWVAEN